MQKPLPGFQRARKAQSPWLRILQRPRGESRSAPPPYSGRSEWLAATRPGIQIRVETEMGLGATNRTALNQMIRRRLIQAWNADWKATAQEDYHE